MWPDENESLDDDDDDGGGGNSTAYVASSGGGVNEGGSATALEVAVAVEAAAQEEEEEAEAGCDRTGGDAKHRREDGMGPGGGLREEWELMTTDEKVKLRYSVFIVWYVVCFVLRVRFVEILRERKREKTTWYGSSLLNKEVTYYSSSSSAAHLWRKKVVGVCPECAGGGIRRAY